MILLFYIMLLYVVIGVVYWDRWRRYLLRKNIQIFSNTVMFLMLLFCLIFWPTLFIIGFFNYICKGEK